MDYCNFDDVKLRLNITGDDYDYQIADFVTTCSRWVDEYCRLPVDGFAVSNDSTRYFGHGDLSIQSGSSVMRLDNPLLTSCFDGNQLRLETQGIKSLLNRQITLPTYA